MAVAASAQRPVRLGGALSAVAAVLLLALAAPVAGRSSRFLAASLRGAGAGGVLQAASSFVSQEPKEDAQFEVVDKQSIEAVASKVECKCDADSFWHPHTKKCVKRGGVGYECGFFKQEHHDDVCADGLYCAVLEGSDKTYFHHGAVPANCQECKDPTQCKKEATPCGETYSFEGQACATVRVTVGAVAANVTEEAEHTAEATAKASANATSTKTVGEVSVRKTATAAAEASASASASASAEASAEAGGVAEMRFCVTPREAAVEANVSIAEKVSDADAAKVVFQGDAMAIDGAYAAAREEATRLGEAAAKKAAEEASTEQAQESAKGAAEQAAQEKAHEAASAKAQEQAQAEADQAAEEEATAMAATATTSAVPETTTAATTTAEATTSQTTTAAPTTAAPATTAEPTTTVATTTLMAPGPTIRPAKEPEVVIPRKVPADHVDDSMP